jgi:hypothetical protein
VLSWGEKNCWSVGGCMAGACTSRSHMLAMQAWGAKGSRGQKAVATFANSLHCAHLASVFHGMQTEVDFWDRLLLLESSQSIVYLDSVLHPMWERTSVRLAIHDRDLEN